MTKDISYAVLHCWKKLFIREQIKNTEAVEREQNNVLKLWLCNKIIIEPWSVGEIASYEESLAAPFSS